MTDFSHRPVLLEPTIDALTLPRFGKRSQDLPDAGERDAQRLVLGVWAHEGRLSVDLAVMIAHLLEK